MGYHLSKRNEAFLLDFLPVLKNAKDSVTLETNDPQRLIYILRNAAGTKEYKWLGEKFIFAKGISTKADRITPAVHCKIRKMSVNISDGLRSIDEYTDLVGIVNLLINEKPIAIRFTNAFLTESEYERLEAYCQTNHFKVTRDNTNVTVIKDG